MLATILYIVGVVLAVLAVLEILKAKIKTGPKLLLSLFIILTSWLGIILYYLIIKKNLSKWFK